MIPGLYNFTFAIFFLISLNFIVRTILLRFKTKLNEANYLFGLITLIVFISNINQLIIFFNPEFFFNNKIILKHLIRFFITFASIFFLFLILKKFFKKNSIKNIFQINYTFLINAYLFLLIFCSFSIVLDGDSLIYHIKIPYLISEGYKISHFIDNIHFLLIGSFEIFNILPLLIKIDNLNSILSVYFVTLFIAYLRRKKIKNKELLLLVILSSPILFSLTLSQKPFIIPLIAQLVFCEVNFRRKFVNNFETLLSFMALFASMSMKLNFIISGGLILIIYFLYNYKPMLNIESFKKIFLSFSIILLPILIFRYFSFGDPLAPFLNFLMSGIYPKDILINFAQSLETWNKNNLIFPFNLFWSNQIINLNNTLGFGLIVFLFQKNIVQNKKILFVALLLIIFNILFVQQTSRFFLLPYLLLFLSLNFEKIKYVKFFKFLFSVKILFFFIILSVFYVPALIKINLFGNEATKEKIIFRYKALKIIENKIGVNNIIIFDNPNYYSKNIDIGRMIIQYANSKEDLKDYINFINKLDPKYLVLTENEIKDKKFFNLKNQQIENFFINCFNKEIYRFSINRASRKNLISKNKENVNFFLYEKNKKCKF